MKTISIKNLLVNISLIVFVIVCTLRNYIDNFFFSNCSLILFAFSILLLLIVILKKGKLRVYNKKYIFISILFILPIFYNNAYIKDNIYSTFMYSIFVIIYGMLLSVSELNEKNIEKALICFGLFSILTSIVTWISFFNPSLYIQKIVTLLPINVREDIIKNFIYLNCRPGLTSHYSRNAFFIILGLLTFVYYYIKNKGIKKINIYLIPSIFLATTLLLVGKRGHLIFIIISMILSYFIYNKVSFKNICKFISIILVGTAFSFLAIKYIPGADTAYNRMFNNESSDISSGRLEMYENAYKLYKQNSYVGIGWGQYSRSTNYYHNGLHNDYLQLLFETGIIGFIIIIGGNIYILSRAIMYSKSFKNGLAYIVLVYNIFYMLYSLTGLPHFDADSNMYYYFINAVLFYYLGISKKGVYNYEK